MTTGTAGYGIYNSREFLVQRPYYTILNVDLAASFMNASRIGIFWFYTLQGPYPSSSYGAVRRDDQSIRSELLPRLNPRIDNPHHGDPKGNKFRKKDELYQEDQESEIPRIPRVGKVDLCLIPK